MKLKALVLCCVILSKGFHTLEGTLQRSSDTAKASPHYEQELFDFETGNESNADFFSFQEADFLEEQNNQSQIAKVKQWFIDQYNYFLLRCFIFYIDLKDARTVYISFLKSHYRLWYNGLQLYWKRIREKFWAR